MSRVNRIAATVYARETQPAEEAAAWLDSVMQIQRIQIDSLRAWQLAITAVNQEFWTRCNGRWTGATPTDE